MQRAVRCVGSRLDCGRMAYKAAPIASSCHERAPPRPSLRLREAHLGGGPVSGTDADSGAAVLRKGSGRGRGAGAVGQERTASKNAGREILDSAKDDGQAVDLAVAASMRPLPEVTRVTMSSWSPSSQTPGIHVGSGGLEWARGTRESSNPTTSTTRACRFALTGTSQATGGTRRR